MTDKEKLEAIRTEIHRLVDVRGYDRGMANDLFAFMDSLPNEPVSEDLEEEIHRYYVDWDEHPQYVQTARHFAKWQEAQMIDKACAWLSNVCIEDMTYKYDDFDTSEGWYKFIEDFKKYMEE